MHNQGLMSTWTEDGRLWLESRPPLVSLGNLKSFAAPVSRREFELTRDRLSGMEPRLHHDIRWHPIPMSDALDRMVKINSSVEWDPDPELELALREWEEEAR